MKHSDLFSFSCDDCVGVCCISAPQLSNIADVHYVTKSTSKSLVATEVARGLYMVAVDKKGQDYCPFLENHGNRNCSLHGTDKKFNVCTTLECKLTQQTYQDTEHLVGTLLSYLKQGGSAMVAEGTSTTTSLFTIETIKHYSIPIKDFETFTSDTGGISHTSLAEMLIEQEKKIKNEW